LFYKFPMGKRKNFFDLYRQLGQAPSKTFALPDLVELENLFIKQ
jgi:hypothetical protein